MNNLILWYKQPAKNWTEALPLGNGHTGAMVYGGTGIEKIDLTENTCYSGEISDFNSQENASMYIPQIRDALFRNDYKKADELSQHITGRKLNYGTNLPFGNLILDFENQKDEVTEYTRELQLENALSVVKYKKGNVQYIREFFVSHPNKVAVMRVSCSEPDILDFSASIDGWDNPHSVEIGKDGDMVLNGHAYETIHSDGKVGVTIHGRMRVIAQNGTVSTQDNKICIKGAESAVILLAIGTDFADSDIAVSCKKCIDAAAAVTYEDLKSIHINDHQSLFNRVTFELPGNSNSYLPTDQRLNEIKKGGEDPALTALMFQYGRYLLMSSSREDSPLPAHLQGIWNDNIACRIGWTCDMHLDINTEMNYWPTEVTNLSECGTPLFNWVEDRLVPSGKQTAKNTYGLDGWVAHVLSNAFGYSAPGWGLSWGLGPTCGMWVATHLWEHYQFTGDKEFLHNEVYPVYREALKFFLGYLTKDPESGYYLSGPSISPENCFMYDWNNSIVANVSMGTVCDTIIIRELLNSFISTCEILDIKDDLLAETKEKLEKLPPFKIGRLGQLQEWFYDFDEPDPHHRHSTHLLSVFPFSQITPGETPELARAARVTIKKRTSPEWTWEDTGWARSLLINYTARLQDTETFYRFILAFQRGLTNDNLLSFCPPGAGADTNVFEMDGTTGLCSGIAESLMQSHNGVINLLPALPEKWDAGSVKGLRARGGYVVDIVWKEHKPVSAGIYSEHGGTCTIKYKDKILQIDTGKGERYILDNERNDNIFA